jgi:adenylosuccinate synthase
MMKSDVLDTFDTIKVCNAYEVDGKLTDAFPYSIDDPERVKPVYTELPGWKTDLTGITSPEQFPAAFKDYIAYLERELGVPVAIVSVGPDRAQTIEL